jgi:hypothetical protein
LEKGNERKLSRLPVDFSGGSRQGSTDRRSRTVLGLQRGDLYSRADGPEHSHILERMDADRRHTGGIVRHALARDSINAARLGHRAVRITYSHARAIGATTPGGSSRAERRDSCNSASAG